MIESLITRRLELRPWRAEDAPDLYAIARDPQVGPAAGWQPHRSVEESAEVIRTVFASPETYAVVLRETGRPVGCVGLLFPSSSHFRIGATEAEVGYWIGTSWRGRGLMPEALGGLVRRAFEELELTALWGSCFVGNAASRRVMEKCGFRYLLALLDGRPCGYVSVEREGEQLFHLQKIYVLPQAQGLGVGRRLFQQAVEHVRRNASGPCRMELNVNRHNRALHFYEHMGMRRLREGDFPIGGGFYMNDYIMGLDLA